MKKFKLILFSFILFNLKLVTAQTNSLGIIPAPKSVKVNDGHFVISRESAIEYENASDKQIAELYHDYLKDNYFLDLPVAKNFVKAPKGVIRFSSANYKGSNPEGYTITVTPQHIDVSGKGSGLFYGLQSMMQLLPLEKEAAPKIQCAEITDEPRYKYRGLHLDVGRHMFPVPFIKKYIDLIAQYKLNTFHWHLTEDQGWRIEIKKYPKLTQVGGFRDQTVIGNYHDYSPLQYDGKKYGGYYTQDEVKEVVAYATSKFVTVIPEIELPGHSLSALTAYPELGCGDNPGPYKVAQKWGVFEDIYCAGKEHTFNFLEDVLTEVMALFPSTYIHIGGDEAPKEKWKTCPYCQKRIKDNHLKDEHELQSYFIQRIEKFLNSKGRKIIGWDEILEGGLAPNATVMSWRGIEGGIAAAKQNHDVIMTPGTYVYFDHAEGNTAQEPVTIGGYLPLSTVYSYDPTPESLTPEQQKFVIGVQANLWTEYMQTSSKVEYMLLPRLLALSEIAWTPLNRKDFTNFNEVRVPVHLAKLDRTETLYRVPAPIGISDTTLLGSEFNLSLNAPVKDAKIYYTINGYTPRETDNLYENGIYVKVPEGEKRFLKTIVITPSGKRSAVTTTILSNELPLEPAASTTNGLKAGLKYYAVPGVFENALQIDTAQAIDKGVTSSIDFSKFRSKIGRGKSFGVIYTGFINIPEDGTYTFTTRSDDGSRLWLDDRLIVNNDMRHAAFEQTSATKLQKGLHRIKIAYFQVNGGEFKTFMSQPGKTRSVIPVNVLYN
ncbi:family 20 glycosylhydrolase [Rubrolithibacter danxiaensis]|uniref:family 20 glycosylhydrolase n=1 Tax=Rubrolithibacter danxiaensis TaxID=3390805 RepID=UPI003BF819F6